MKVNFNKAFIDADGKEVASGAGNDITLSIENVHLWSTEDPYLYNVRVELPGKDSYETHCGVRTISHDDKSILLNGKPIKLRGFGKHEDLKA